MESILAFLPPSLMVRSTCTAFRAAAEKVHKPVKKHWATSMDDALASASLVDWALQNGFQPQMAYKASIRRGDVPALRRGHLEMLQWLHANGYPWDWGSSHAAAAGGHFEVLQWLHANGCPWDTLTCPRAARRGDLQTLQWLRANGCPWDEETCCSAAEQGHLQAYQGNANMAADAFFSGQANAIIAQQQSQRRRGGGNGGGGRGGAQQRQRSGGGARAPQLPAIDAWFNRFRDDGSSGMDETDAMGEAGIQSFCEELQMDTQEPAVLALAQAMRAGDMGEFTRAEFRRGMTALGVDSPAEFMRAEFHRGMTALGVDSPAEVRARAVVMLSAALCEAMLSTAPVCGSTVTNEFRRGMTALGVDSPAELQALLPGVRAQMADHKSKLFQDVYAFAFDFAREGASKTLAMEDACALWSVLLTDKPFPLLQDLFDFLAGGRGGSGAGAGGGGGSGSTSLPSPAARVHRDLWAQVPLFLSHVGADFAGYDAGDAWPVALDDFAEFMMQQQGGGGGQ
ncbi:Cullin binding-domain-containing protein [Tribonema minus]|uniref:Defective in cullin neddylation protein n=1 Tax=Tribonema minus TaxID=303371 RepID=A0A835Z322_9STRA|nr:Cullin binding-domain-containing protein [Tribonema minus]